MAAAPLTFSPQPAEWQIFIRSQALVVPLIELLAILLVMRMGGSIRTGWQNLPRLTRWAMALFLPTMLMVTYQPGNDYVLASLGLLRLLMLGLLALALASLTARQLSDFLGKAWTMIGFGILAYFAVFIVYIFSNRLVGGQWIEHLPGFNNIRHIAFLGFVAFAIGIARRPAVNARPSNWQPLLVPAAFGALGMILPIWSGSRGPLLACLLLAGLLWITQKSDRRFVALYTLGTLGFAFVMASLVPVPNAIFGPAQAFGAADLHAMGAADASSGRLELWRGTIDHIAQRPWLGWGVNQFSGFEPIPHEVFFHPHNYPLQLLHACGIVGVLAVAFSMISIVARHKAFLMTNQGRFHVALFCALAIYSLYDGIFYFAYPLLISMLTMVPFLQAPAQRIDDSEHG
jgi:O-antigen ligase